MALEQIFTKILEDAKQEAQNILDTASKEAGDIIQMIEKEAAQLKDEIISTAKTEGELAFRKEVIAQKLNAQKDLLQSKRSRLDDCFKEAQEALVNLDDDLCSKLISNMLARINFKTEAEIIFSTRDKARIHQDYIRKTNPHLKLSFSDDIPDGFVLKTSELIVDNSLGNILTSLRAGLEPKVAQILFEE